MSWDTILTPRSHSGVKIVLEYPNQDCKDNGHRINSRFTFHKGDSSSVSRSIRTQRKTSDTRYNVHIIQSYVGILDSPKHKFKYTREYFDQDVTSGVDRFNGTYLGVKVIHPRYPDQLGHKGRLWTLDTMFTDTVFTSYNHTSKSWIPPTKI